PEDEAVAVEWQRWLGGRWHAPTPASMSAGIDDFRKPRNDSAGLLHKLGFRAQQMLINLAHDTRLSTLAPNWPTPFGLFVTMTRLASPRGKMACSTAPVCLPRARTHRESPPHDLKSTATR